MSEKDNNQQPSATSAEGEATKQVFRVQRVYLKDVSYESPLSPGIFAGGTQWQPKVSLQLNTESTKLKNSMYEVVLTVTATVKINEEIGYLAEIKQAGLFQIAGFTAERLGPTLGSFCPNLLFPFAREEIASLVQKGGFPQLLLDPVNFDALYAQHVEAARQNAPAPGTSQ